MGWKEGHLDFVLVPCGFLVLLVYHLVHFSRCWSAKHEGSTVIGYENICRREWVKRIMKGENRGQAITVMSNNLSAANSLAAVSLTLSSLIGALIGSLYHNDYIGERIYGNKSATMIYIKYISLLSCFMLAFGSFIQAARCFVQANFLISMPEETDLEETDVHVSTKIVKNAVIKGSNSWVVGVRSLYFAINLLLWIFGPIPMFVSALITVLLLQYLDNISDNTDEADSQGNQNGIP